MPYAVVVLFTIKPDAPHAMDYYIWVLRRGSEVIVVDTGYDMAEAAARNRPIRMEPAEALAPFGIKPEDVTTVIVTIYTMITQVGCIYFRTRNCT